jgi:hypothetical protein
MDHDRMRFFFDSPPRMKRVPTFAASLFLRLRWDHDGSRSACFLLDARLTRNSRIPKCASSFLDAGDKITSDWSGIPILAGE